MLAVLALAAQQAMAADWIFGSPQYAHTCTISRWGNAVTVSDYGRGEVYLSSYTAVAGGAQVRGYMHQDFVWDNPTGRGTARFDFALCAEVAVGTEISSVQITVTGFLRDITTTKYPINTVLYSYTKSNLGYELFITGGPQNLGVQMVNGHRYTIGYTVDVSAYCYPRSYCPMACANVGEQGCSFWWQPTGVFSG